MVVGHAGGAAPLVCGDEGADGEQRERRREQKVRPPLESALSGNGARACAQRGVRVSPLPPCAVSPSVLGRNKHHLVSSV